MHTWLLLCGICSNTSLYGRHLFIDTVGLCTCDSAGLSTVCSLTHPQITHRTGPFTFSWCHMRCGNHVWLTIASWPVPRHVMCFHILMLSMFPDCLARVLMLPREILQFTHRTLHCVRQSRLLNSLMTLVRNNFLRSPVSSAKL